MQYRLLPTKKAPEIPVLARFASPKPSLPVMFGAPNISGFVANLAGDLGGTGPFVNQQNAGTGWGPEDSRGNTRQFFDAAIAHYLYGASNTVQPAAMLAIACIKV